jgi:hypothetical protein
VPAEHDDYRTLASGGVRDRVNHAQKIPGDKNVWQRFEECTEAAIGAGR